MQLKYKHNSTNQSSHKIALYSAICENMMNKLKLF